MDVAAEVVEQMLGRAERLFGVDVPRLFSQSFEQKAEVSRIGQRSGFAREAKFLLMECLFEKVEKLAAEDGAQGFYTEEKVFARGDPLVLIE